MFQSFSLVLLVAAILSFVNYKWLKLPSTIGVMLLSLLTALIVIISKPLVPGVYAFFCDLVLSADFKTLLLDAMLSILLFAGAMHVNIKELNKEKWSVLVFASVGVIISTFLIGGLIYLLLPLVGLSIPLLHAFLFGALISPTDPIAVISILRKAGVSTSLELKIEGESLFNDGVGVVVFTAFILLIEGSGAEPGSIGAEIARHFVNEVIGGLAFGAVSGFLGFKLIKSVEENAHLSILLSLAIALGGYSIASIFHFSGPLAMVVAGLIIGNKVFSHSFSEDTQKQLNGLWEIFDESLNGVLFVMLGLVIHLLTFNMQLFFASLIAVTVVLFGRAVSVTLPFSILKHNEHTFWPTCAILTWGGLKGGISLALALSVPNEYSGEIILTITYGVVLFSILVQGLSIGKLVHRLFT